MSFHWIIIEFESALYVERIVIDGAYKCNTISELKLRNEVQKKNEVSCQVIQVDEAYVKLTSV